MKAKQKRRMFAVGGVIVVVVILVLAIVAGGSAARTLTVAEAASGDYSGDKVQVSGQVVTGSFELTPELASFSIYDGEADPKAATPLKIEFRGAVSSTFGNGVTAIVTGRLDEAGVLQATELVTKCPSKYESGTDALSVEQLISYGAQVQDKPVRVSAVMVSGSLVGPGAAVRFSAADEAGATPVLPVQFDGAIPDEAMTSRIILTGSIGTDGVFVCTALAMEA